MSIEFDHRKGVFYFEKCSPDEQALRELLEGLHPHGEVAVKRTPPVRRVDSSQSFIGRRISPKPSKS